MIDKENILIVDNVNYHVDLIEPPCPFGGKIVKLRREFIFAKLDLSTSEQRLLFSAMSQFETESFLTNPEIIEKTMSDGKQDFDKLEQNDYDKHFCTVESRTILLSMYETARLTNTRNYEVLASSILQLQDNANVTFSRKQDGKTATEKLSMIERSRRYSFGDDRPDVLLITFTQSFMPYLVAFKNYDKLSMEHLCSFKSKYSYRYLQWFTAILGSKSAETLYITVDQLKDRLAIDPEAYKQHFVKRVVDGPIAEISKITDFDIKVVPERNSKKRGKPIERFKFIVKRKQEQESLPFDDDTFH